MVRKKGNSEKKYPQKTNKKNKNSKNIQIYRKREECNTILPYFVEMPWEAIHRVREIFVNGINQIITESVAKYIFSIA